MQIQIKQCLTEKSESLDLSSLTFSDKSLEKSKLLQCNHITKLDLSKLYYIILNIFISVTMFSSMANHVSKIE